MRSLWTLRQLACRTSGPPVSDHTTTLVAGARFVAPARARVYLSSSPRRGAQRLTLSGRSCLRCYAEHVRFRCSRDAPGRRRRTLPLRPRTGGPASGLANGILQRAMLLWPALCPRDDRGVAPNAGHVNLGTRRFDSNRGAHNRSTRMSRHAQLGQGVVFGAKGSNLRPPDPILCATTRYAADDRRQCRRASPVSIAGSTPRRAVSPQAD